MIINNPEKVLIKIYTYNNDGDRELESAVLNIGNKQTKEIPLVVRQAALERTLNQIFNQLKGKIVNSIDS